MWASAKAMQVCLLPKCLLFMQTHSLAVARILRWLQMFDNAAPIKQVGLESSLPVSWLSICLPAQWGLSPVTDIAYELY